MLSRGKALSGKLGQLGVYHLSVFSSLWWRDHPKHGNKFKPTRHTTEATTMPSSSTHRRDLAKIIRPAKTGTTRPWKQLPEERQGSEGVGFFNTAPTKTFEKLMFGFLRRIRQLAQILHFGTGA